MFLKGSKSKPGSTLKRNFTPLVKDQNVKLFLKYKKNLFTNETSSFFVLTKITSAFKLMHCQIKILNKVDPSIFVLIDFE